MHSVNSAMQYIIYIAIYTIICIPITCYCDYQQKEDQQYYEENTGKNSYPNRHICSKSSIICKE